MDAILVLANQVKSLVPKRHVPDLDQPIVNLTKIVILDFIVPNNPVMMLFKVLALVCLRTVLPSTNQFADVIIKPTVTRVTATVLVLT
jgi:hypothetical protein